MLISNAYAQTEAAAGLMGSLTQFLPIILMFVVIYFMMIRPHQKKNKEHKALLEALCKGDEVITLSGIAGRITKVGDDYVTIAIAENVEVQMQKVAVALVLPKGTIKNM